MVGRRPAARKYLVGRRNLATRVGGVGV